MAVRPGSIDLTIRRGCTGCSKVCNFKPAQAREDRPSAKITRMYGCNSNERR